MGLPTHYKTVIWIRDESNQTFHFQIQNVLLPTPGPQEVLIQLSCTGVCGSDIALASGSLGPPCVPILGHEGVGRVISLGSSLSTSDVKIGTRVGVAWQRDVCGTCEMCLYPGGETRCLSLMTGRRVSGAFAEYTIVPYRYLTPVTEEINDELIAAILCGGVTIYKGLKICGATPGQWIVISGLLGIQYAKAMGYRVIALNAGAEKEQYCKQLGAEIYIDVSSSQDTISTVHEKSGGLGAAAVLVTAGSSRAYQDAIPMLGPFGTLVCIGIPPPEQTVNFHPITFLDQGIRIIGSVVGTRLDIREALTFVERGLVTPKVHMAKLEDLSEISKQIKSGKAIGKFVIRFRPASREESAKL